MVLHEKSDLVHTAINEDGYEYNVIEKYLTITFGFNIIPFRMWRYDGLPIIEVGLLFWTLCYSTHHYWHTCNNYHLDVKSIVKCAKAEK